MVRGSVVLAASAGFARPRLQLRPAAAPPAASCGRSPPCWPSAWVPWWYSMLCWSPRPCMHGQRQCTNLQHACMDACCVVRRRAMLLRLADSTTLTAHSRAPQTCCPPTTLLHNLLQPGPGRSPTGLQSHVSQPQSCKHKGRWPMPIHAVTSSSRACQVLNQTDYGPALTAPPNDMFAARTSD